MMQQQQQQQQQQQAQQQQRANLNNPQANQVCIVDMVVMVYHWTYQNSQLKIQTFCLKAAQCTTDDASSDAEQQSRLTAFTSTTGEWINFYLFFVNFYDDMIKCLIVISHHNHRIHNTVPLWVCRINKEWVRTEWAFVHTIQMHRTMRHHSILCKKNLKKKSSIFLFITDSG